MKEADDCPQTTTFHKGEKRRKQAIILKLIHEATLSKHKQLEINTKLRKENRSSWKPIEGN